MASWKKRIIQELKADNKGLFVAAANAQKAADYIMGRSEQSIYDRFPFKAEGLPPTTTNLAKSNDTIQIKARAIASKMAMLELEIELF